MYLEIYERISIFSGSRSTVRREEERIGTEYIHGG